MAAVTVADQTTDDRSNPRATGNGVPLQGRKHRKFGLITVTTTGDTLETGISNIVELAWRPTAVTDQVAPVLTVQATGTVAFVAAAGGETGYLHVWSGD